MNDKFSQNYHVLFITTWLKVVIISFIAQNADEIIVQIFL